MEDNECRPAVMMRCLYHRGSCFLWSREDKQGCADFITEDQWDH